MLLQEPREPASNAPKPRRWLATSCVLVIFTAVLLLRAWVSDDAYITFRTIDNFVHGFGMRWNVAERVQAYTHPLWLLLLIPFYRVTGELYFTSIAISVTLTLMMVRRIATARSTHDGAIIALAILLCSRAFIDYSTSGLENALTHVLLGAALWAYLFCERLTVLPLLTGLLVTNRLDTGLLMAPVLVALGRQRAERPRLAWWLLGLVPLSLWEVFSVLYYGFPFPNTAYAKLQTGIPERELVSQGILYLLDAFQRDPLTPLTIAAATLWALARTPRARPVALGIALYIVYVIYIGGDFMSGRLLTPPLVAAVMIILTINVGRHRITVLTATAALIVLALWAPAIVRPDPGWDERTGIDDERQFYSATNGLMNFSRHTPWPAHSAAASGRAARLRGERTVIYCCNGMLGYFAGPSVYIVDFMGLGDPLMARLPAVRPWRIGHFQRLVPAGYVDTIETGQNHIRDPALAGFYSRLSLITRAPIWERRRLRAIVRMNLYGRVPEPAAPRY